MGDWVIPAGLVLAGMYVLAEAEKAKNISITGSRVMTDGKTVSFGGYAVPDMNSQDEYRAQIGIALGLLSKAYQLVGSENNSLRQSSFEILDGARFELEAIYKKLMPGQAGFESIKRDVKNAIIRAKVSVDTVVTFGNVDKSQFASLSAELAKSASDVGRVIADTTATLAKEGAKIGASFFSGLGWLGLVLLAGAVFYLARVIRL